MKHPARYCHLPSFRELSRTFGNNYQNNQINIISKLSLLQFSFFASRVTGAGGRMETKQVKRHFMATRTKTVIILQNVRRSQ